MDIERIKFQLAKGNLKSAITDLLSIADKYLLTFNDEILLISSRYYTIEREKVRNVISKENYFLELNSISNDILLVLGYLEELDEVKLKNISRQSIKEELDKLLEDYEDCRKIKSTATRLRMKNNLSHLISQKIIQYPKIVNEYVNNPTDGFICGVCKKIQRVPDFEDLDILEKIAPETNSKFVKGNIASAITELIYFSKVRIGDDVRISKILNLLKVGSDKTVQKNIERAEAALEYLLNK